MLTITHQENGNLCGKDDTDWGDKRNKRYNIHKIIQ
jgi:hypothetical protein